VRPIAGLETEARGKNPLPLVGFEPWSPGRPVNKASYKRRNSALRTERSEVREAKAGLEQRAPLQINCDTLEHMRVLHRKQGDSIRKNCSRENKSQRQRGHISPAGPAHHLGNEGQKYGNSAGY
jgi:hypothetical protein